MEPVATRTIKDDIYTELSISFRNGAEVLCPYHDREVDIIEEDGCLPLEGRGGCQFLNAIKPGKILCLWTEAEGRTEAL